MANLILALALARIIAGEAPGCPTEARFAVAHVYANRIEAGIEGGWFGDAEPTVTEIYIAYYYRLWPDPTQGGLYLIGPGDLERMAKYGMYLKDQTAFWQCKETTLTAYRTAVFVGK